MVRDARHDEQQVGQTIEVDEQFGLDRVATKGYDAALRAPADRSRHVQRSVFQSGADLGRWILGRKCNVQRGVTWIGRAATALGFTSVTDLQSALAAHCGGR